MEWLFSHPEDLSIAPAPAAPAPEQATGDAQQLKVSPAQVGQLVKLFWEAQAATTLANMSPLYLYGCAKVLDQRVQAQGTLHDPAGKQRHDTTRPASFDSEHGAVTTAVYGGQDIVKPQRDGPSTEELVCGAVAVLEKVPSAAHSLAELLLAHCAGRPERAQALMACLAARLARQDPPPTPEALLATAHLAAVLCDMSVPVRIAGVSAGRRGLCLIIDAQAGCGVHHQGTCGVPCE